MSALVERLISARDGITGLNISEYALVREARASMAEAANALTQIEALARRVSRLNPDSHEIGAGMLAQLVEDASRALKALEGR